MLHNKFWQGFFALAPLLVILVAIGAYISFFLSLMQNSMEMEGSGDPSRSFIMGGIGFFMFFIFLAIILSLSSLIFYILHAVQNPNLKENNLLVVWILLFIFISGIGQLIYWIVEIVSKRNKTSTTQVQ
ncbi:MAG: hypothetical protein AB3N14_15075 [Flavobacteriaceae bacterium]